MSMTQVRMRKTHQSVPLVHRSFNHVLLASLLVKDSKGRRRICGDIDEEGQACKLQCVFSSLKKCHFKLNLVNSFSSQVGLEGIPPQV